ncbi:hypothetical protein ACFPYI_05180 [Halomarina salina]|uniref:DUF2092 domain-containing protein n=1 Tax=Halomarina salina TaxID=1872699 RepID=A0ABD5RJD5_9EURY|nr:hypothetical protein [Halomarina salina]
MRRLLPVFLAVLVVLSGCNGIGLPGASDGPPTGDSNVTTTGEGATPRTPGGNVTAASVKADALAAIDEVTTYSVRVDQHTRYVERNQTSTANVTGEFNRTERDLALNQSRVVSGIAVSTETYIDGRNGTFYQYSPALEQEFGSSWVRASVAGDAEVWDQYDTLSRQRDLLAASNVSLEGVQTVNGTDAYVLTGSPNASRFQDLGIGSGSSLEVSNITATFYVSVEDATLVGSTVELAGTQQARGRSLPFQRTADIRFSGYGDPVTVTIPDEADDAVSVGSLNTS